MSIVPRSVKAFLFVLGLLACVAINAHDRFDSRQFIGITVITFAFTLATWVRSKKNNEGKNYILIKKITNVLGKSFG